MIQSYHIEILTIKKNSQSTINIDQLTTRTHIHIKPSNNSFWWGLQNMSWSFPVSEITKSNKSIKWTNLNLDQSIINWFYPEDKVCNIGWFVLSSTVWWDNRNRNWRIWKHYKNYYNQNENRMGKDFFSDKFSISRGVLS